MNSRNIVRLFMTTLIIGGVTAGLAGFVARWDQFAPMFSSFDLGEILSTFVWMFGVGLIFSVISQAGYFAYLTVHRFGLGIFRSASLWNAVQLVLVIFVLFDLVYLRFITFAEGEGLGSYLGLAILLLIVGLIVAYFKMKQTNKQAFIPALFFMTVVTILEWVPVLRVNDESWIYFMLLPLLVCNAYQLLILNKLIERSQRELESKRASKQKSGKQAIRKGNKQKVKTK
ncbi:KinB-signaling pathway activation protein [Peribacillus cavernae]|uniref:KinB-signaling pathway activation protein n=1 Tax=Peribacillus cavernae TaxID=1674310 RepID=A0A3S0VDN7_9BACI|nr:KinB-signaling pathway activation protein [Peribacillus cavernae]MDQ0220612.1 KinB signaling pathway activation protein [Peribacillus cavernae]RUQ24156.1 KinB-signaling pathway activation protein [Peribacillus cavernae]